MGLACVRSAVRASGTTPYEVRYEPMATDAAGTAEGLAAYLDAPAAPLATALADAHAASIGRYRRDLTPGQLADVESEAGQLLGELGYCSRAANSLQ